MANAMFFIRTISVMLVVVAGNVVADGFGVNWGNIASHPINPSIVVGLLKDNGINKVKLFDSDSWTLTALAGTNIEVMVGIPNDQLQTMAEDYDSAQDWVKENVTQYLHNGGVNIKYVAVGNEPFLSSYNNSFVKTTFPAFKNIHKALKEAGHGDKVKVTIPQNAEVYESSTDLPSDGVWRKDIQQLMTDMVKYFHENDCPFTVNIYPFLSLYQNNNFPVEFAFFDGHGSSEKNDKGRKYDNVFDANYDTLVWALKKSGVPDLDIIVGEVGWPTDGNIFANTTMAERYYEGLFKRLGSKTGTPLRPTTEFDVYLFGLIDEDMKSVAPGAFERHWGIFRYDGKPKFHIDFSGKGQKVMPKGAKGVQYLERKWCVVDQDALNAANGNQEVGFACYHGDCTSLGYGSSCNKLDRYWNISYAFNNYFQMNDQSVEACQFNGLAKIVKENATHGSCLFPIQIVSGGQRLEFVYATTTTLVLGFLITLIALN